MNVALRRSMSLTEFLAWEEQQEIRYEFDGFQPVAMTGGTYAHDRITFHLQRALNARLVGRPCQPECEDPDPGQGALPGRAGHLLADQARRDGDRQPGGGFRSGQRGYRTYRPDRE